MVVSVLKGQVVCFVPGVRNMAIEKGLGFKQSSG